MASRILSSSRDADADGGRPELVALDQHDKLDDAVDLQDGPDDVVGPQDALSAQAALTEIARAIVGRSSAREVAQVVVEAVRRLVPSERSAVWAWLPERDALQILAAGSVDFDILGLSAGDVVPVDDGSFRAVVEQGAVQREADLGRHQTRIERALASAGLRSRLVVPVLVNGSPIGMVSTTSRQHDVYTEEHERLLEHLAVHLAIGLEQARLTSQARRHQERLLGLQRVAQRLAASVAGEDVLDMVLDEAVRSVDGDNGTLLIWDEARQVLVPIRNTVPTASEYTVLAPGQGVAGRAIQQLRVVVLEDYQRESGDETPAGKTGVRAAIGAPLIADGRLIGVVTANTLNPHKRFDDSDIQIFELFAGQAAAVLKSVRLFESERRQRRGAEEVARAAAAVVAEMDQQRRLDLIVERAVKLVGGAAGGLDLLDPPTGNLVIRAAYGYPEDLRDRVLPAGKGVGQRVVAERRAVLVENYQAEVDPIGLIDPGAYGSTIGVPVMARGELLGALVIQATAGSPRLMAEDVPLIQTVADLAAVALDNARSLEREQQRRRQIEAVRSVTAELTRELDLPSLLDLILMRAGQIVSCEATAVLLWDEASQTLIPTAWRGLGDWVGTTRFGLGDGAAGAAARLREGVVVEDYRDSGPPTAPASDGAGPTSVMAVPIVYQDRLIGVLTANRFGIAESFNRHDLELLEVFGTQAAVAIENARLFEQATTAEALRELAQLKAELLNTVSHELRTPLSLIHGYAELLVHRADRLDPAEVAQMSGEIYTSSRTLARLVDDLLDFSHLDHGRLQLRRRRIALSDLLESLVRTFGTQAGGERISTDLEPNLEVDADPERLHQVVGNLLTNALAYTAGGPILVRAHREPRAVRIDVVDHGPGLAEEEVGRVWESFYRGTESAQLPNRGSGLGLTVVKQLVELHGGKVGVEETPGGGATFWFTLPVA
jgi:GAF domain-containing protein/anti-sigma regulatory factor (Ser/Thr protein kinase)